jgi:hypothetical protein
LGDANLWKGIKADVALCHEVFNVIDEVYEVVLREIEAR